MILMTQKNIIISLAAVLITGATALITIYINTGSLHNSGESSPLTQSDLAEVFRGETLRFLVPSAPGGGFDAYARLLAPYLEKYTGAQVRVLNRQGAGGMRAVNELFHSPRDGMTIGIMGGSSAISGQMAGIKGADYRVEEFEYLGRVMADTRALVVTSQSGINSFDDVLRTTETIKLGATGLGGTGYIDGVISKEAFNLNIEVIHGFDTLSGVTQSMLRGNLHGAWGPWGSLKNTVESGTGKVILQSSRERDPELPDTPTVFELVNNTEDPDRTLAIIDAWDILTSVGRPVATTPGVPEARVNYLRQAFFETMHDPEFLRTTQRADLPIQYAYAEEIMTIIDEALNLNPELTELFTAAVRGEL
jgi:tripartite-type tricarboxylate transporter receptor subunit TctC